MAKGVTGHWLSLLCAACCLVVVSAGVRVDVTNSTFNLMEDAAEGNDYYLAPGIYKANSILGGIYFNFTVTSEQGDVIFECTNYELIFRGSVSFSNVAFRNCTRPVALLFPGANTVSSVTNCTFYDNRQSIEAYGSNSELIVSDCTFYNNTDTAIKVSTSKATISRIKVISNSPTNNSHVGGVSGYVENEMTITDSVFEGNTAVISSAGINNGIYTVSNSVFKISLDPYVEQFGSYVLSNNTLYITNCTFDQYTNPFVAQQGSKIYITKSNFTWAPIKLFYAEDYSEIFITDSLFSHAQNSSLVLSFNATAQISNTEFSESYGSIEVLGNSSATVTQSTFHRLYELETSPGGFYCESSGLTVTHSTFSNIYGSTTGGSAGYSLDCNLDFTNVTFTHNTVTGTSVKGGVLYIVGGNSVFNKVVFDDNGATSTELALVGGALYAEGGALVSIIGCDFTNNMAQWGGAIGVGAEATVRAIESTFVGNYVSSDGGAIYNAVGDEITLQDCSMLFNYAEEGLGGAIYISSGNNFISTTTISNNLAQAGGAIYQRPQSNLNIADSEINNNNASHPFDDFGGGAIFSAASLSVADTTFRNNSGHFGGAINAIGPSSSATLNNVTITQNKADNGAGIHISNHSKVDIMFSTITFNSALMDGGGCNINTYSTVTIANSTVSSNNAGQNGGGVYVYQAGLSVGGSFIEMNDAGERGGGLFLVADPPIYIGYTTIVGNTASDGSGMQVPYEPGQIIPIIMQQLNLATNGMAEFCCGGSRKNNPENELCNFPACSSMKCREVKNTCDCPFVPSVPLPVIPDMSTVNTTCTCFPGYHGIHDYCELTTPAPCDNNPCGNGICVSDGENFTCTGCPDGYVAKSGKCEDINECSKANGGCDYHVVCNNTMGGFICPSCPTGMHGNSSQMCSTFCGDGICNSTYGETCVNCPQDCSGPCGLCGDGKCDESETCTSCYEDCQVALSCIAPCPSCVHGTCERGLCQCESSWTGPACDVEQSAIIVVANTTAPSTTVTPVANQYVQFSIGLLRIQELNNKGQVVRSIELAQGEQNYTFIGNFSSAGSQQTSAWTYLNVLSNKARINITFFQFEERTTFKFANQSLTFNPHTLKFNVNVTNWPFLSLVNTLAVVIDAKGNQTGSGPNAGCGEPENGFTSSINMDRLQWIKLTRNGVSLYGQFADAALVDGKPRKIQYTLNAANNLISAVLPHFWNNAEFDPSFSVLVTGGDSSSSGCGISKGSKGVNKGAAIGASVGIVGAILLVGAVVFVWRTRNKKKWRRKLITQASNANL